MWKCEIVEESAHIWYHYYIILPDRLMVGRRTVSIGVCVGRSSNGRTTDFGSVYLGSNPSLPAKNKSIARLSLALAFSVLFIHGSCCVSSAGLRNSRNSPARGGII